MKVDLKLDCEETCIENCFTGDLFLFKGDLWEIMNRHNGLINSRTVWAKRDHTVKGFSPDDRVLRILDKVAI